MILKSCVKFQQIHCISSGGTRQALENTRLPGDFNASRQNIRWLIYTAKSSMHKCISLLAPDCKPSSLVYCWNNNAVLCCSVISSKRDSFFKVDGIWNCCCCLFVFPAPASWQKRRIAASRHLAVCLVHFGPKCQWWHKAHYEGTIRGFWVGFFHPKDNFGWRGLTTTRARAVSLRPFHFLFSGESRKNKEEQ